MKKTIAILYSKLKYMSYQQLFEAIEKRVELHPEDYEACKNEFVLEEVRKNSILEALGKRPRHLYFVVSGYMRLYYLGHSGQRPIVRYATPFAIRSPPILIRYWVQGVAQRGAGFSCQLPRPVKSYRLPMISLSS
jgi:hypothetical protein